MLAAIAFERLIEPTKNSAQALASAFADHWAPFAKIRVMDAKRVRPDTKYATVQRDWQLGQKWMKELYEARSAAAHRGTRHELSRNWKTWQHVVIAAFAYPLTVKLRLAEEGLYTLDNRELGACEAFDQLLDSNWGSGWKRPPAWPTILSQAEELRGLQAVIRRAIEYQEKRRT